jgi:hypothetical protein
MKSNFDASVVEVSPLSLSSTFVSHINFAPFFSPPVDAKMLSSGKGEQKSDFSLAGE